MESNLPYVEAKTETMLKTKIHEMCTRSPGLRDHTAPRTPCDSFENENMNEAVRSMAAYMLFSR
jgi:hypothetical protein